MKKCFAMILAAAMLLCAAPLAGFTAIELPELDFGNLFPSAKAAEIVASGTDGDHLNWTLDNAGTLTISGSGEMGDYTYFGSPW